MERQVELDGQTTVALDGSGHFRDIHVLDLPYLRHTGSIGIEEQVERQSRSFVSEPDVEQRDGSNPAHSCNSE